MAYSQKEFCAVPNIESNIDVIDRQTWNSIALALCVTKNIKTEFECMVVTQPARSSYYGDDQLWRRPIIHKNWHSIMATHPYTEQNHLLAALPPDEFDRLSPHLQLVKLKLGKVLYESGGKLKQV
jgi:hypothetical protein